MKLRHSSVLYLANLANHPKMASASTKRSLNVLVKGGPCAPTTAEDYKRSRAALPFSSHNKHPPRRRIRLQPKMSNTATLHAPLQEHSADIAMIMRKLSLIHRVSQSTLNNIADMSKIVQLDGLQQAQLNVDFQSQSQLVNNLDNAVFTLSRQLQRNLVEYGASKCRELCEAMQTSLPRELRDMVYKYILGTPRRHIEDNTSGHTVATRSISNDLNPWKKEFEARGQLHVFDKYYMGSISVYELASEYYRTSTFIFNCDKPMSDRALKRFLYKPPDIWGQSIDVRSLVKSIELQHRAPSRNVSLQLGVLQGLAKPIKICIDLQGLAPETKDDARRLADRVRDNLTGTYPPWTMQDKSSFIKHEINFTFNGNYKGNFKRAANGGGLGLEVLSERLFAAFRGANAGQ